MGRELREGKADRRSRELDREGLSSFIQRRRLSGSMFRLQWERMRLMI